MKKCRIKILLFFALLLLVANPSIYAQDGPDGPPPGEEEGPEGPPASPINKAIPLLVIAGVGLAYKMHQKKLSDKI